MRELNKYHMYAERNTPSGWVIDISVCDNPYKFSNFTTAWNSACEFGVDLNGVANPKVYILNKTTFLMGYNGFDKGNSGNLRFAISEDGINWKTFNDGKVILEKINGTWDSYRMEKVFLHFGDDDIKLYYFASPSEAQKYECKIGIATLKK